MRKAAFDCGAAAEGEQRVSSYWAAEAVRIEELTFDSAAEARSSRKERRAINKRAKARAVLGQAGKGATGRANRGAVE